jgi:hypothetical protein
MTVFESDGREAEQCKSFMKLSDVSTLHVKIRQARATVVLACTNLDRHRQ